VDVISTVRRLIEEAPRVVAFTGSGISVESGIPTFRGPDGLWRKYRAEDLATPAAFARDPKLVWEWYDWRRQNMAKAQPNAGHRALARLEGRKAGFELITQNVDGLHDRAGSRRIHTLHGDIWMVRCVECGAERQDWRAPLPEIPPRCECGGLLRPGVVWFGEPLDAAVWTGAERASTAADVFLVIGTSAIVYPAAGLIDAAKIGGAKLVEINPDETSYSEMIEYVLRGRAGEILPRVIPE
jgi:NAD-dependent deacetylase